MESEKEKCRRGELYDANYDGRAAALQGGLSRV